MTLPVLVGLLLGSSAQGAAPVAPLQREASLVELHGGFRVVAVEASDKPQVSFPLPRRYRGQVPLSFSLKVKPESARVGVRVLPSACDDRVLELTLAPMKASESVEVEWRSLVATDVGERFAGLPAVAPFPARFPDEAAAWLAPSLYVQSADRRIVRAARGMKGKDVVETITKTLAGQQRILMGQRERATDLSSLQALDREGSCTSNANLLAALLRANGVPARILAGYPTWAERPFQTHYIVEAYVPDFGWYPIEPTMGVAGWGCTGMPIVSIVPVAHEDRGGQRAAIAPGVPYLTLNETSAGIIAWGALTKDGSDHEARFVRGKSLAPASWDAEGARWDAWLKEGYRAWTNLDPSTNVK